MKLDMNHSYQTSIHVQVDPTTVQMKKPALVPPTSLARRLLVRLRCCQKWHVIDKNQKIVRNCLFSKITNIIFKFTASTPAGPWPETSSKFTVVKKIYEEAITITSAMKGKKYTIDMKKIVVSGTLTDLTDAFVGYKNNTEETFSADSYLAFRCEDPSNCIHIPFRYPSH